MSCLSFCPPLWGFLHAIFWQVPGGSVGGAAEDGCGARRFHWWVGPKKKAWDLLHLLWWFWVGKVRISFVVSLIFMDVSILSDDLDGNSDDLAVFFWWVWMAKWLWLFWWEVLLISVFLWIRKLMIANGNWSIGTPVRNLFDEKNGYKYILYIYMRSYLGGS